MKEFEFPKHPDTELVASRRRARKSLESNFLRVQPSVYGILTFSRQPPNPHAALKHVRGFANQISGRLGELVMWWAVAERGTALDRLHCHAFFCCEAPSEYRIFLFEYHWKHGESKLSSYRPGGRAKSYTAGKIARDEVWECSTKLAKRIGPFMESDAA